MECIKVVLKLWVVFDTDAAVAGMCPESCIHVTGAFSYKSN